MSREERVHESGVRENTDPEEKISSSKYFADPLIPELIGGSKAMRDLREKIMRDCVTNDDSVLITGESGTGKELIASAIHRLSARSSKPFVAINCGNVPDDLVESEFFGCVKGSFTGATSDRRGYFLQANHGTLFMDEVAEMSPKTQTKLLRVLQDKKVLRLGTSVAQQTDVRIIAATNQDLNVMIEQERFREDLYFRISDIEIHTPTLRERAEDIPELARYFIDQRDSGFARRSIEDGALELLSLYDWPGNVRELRRVIRRLLRQLDPQETVTPFAVLSLLTEMKVQIRPVRPRRGNAIPLPDEVKIVGPYESLRCIEKRAKLLVMEWATRLSGDRCAAAERLGVSRGALNRGIARLRARSKEIEEGRHKGCLIPDNDGEAVPEIEHGIILPFERPVLVLPNEAALVREYETLNDFLARLRNLVIRAAFQVLGTRMAAANRLRTSPKIISQALWAA